MIINQINNQTIIKPKPKTFIEGRYYKTKTTNIRDLINSASGFNENMLEAFGNGQHKKIIKINGQNEEHGQATLMFEGMSFWSYWRGDFWETNETGEVIETETYD